MKWILLLGITFCVVSLVQAEVLLPEYKLNDLDYDYFANKTEEEIVRVNLIFKTAEEAKDLVSRLEEAGVKILSGGGEQASIKIETTFSLLNKISSMDEIVSIEPDEPERTRVRKMESAMESPKLEEVKPLEQACLVELKPLTHHLPPTVSYEDKFIEDSGLLELDHNQRIVVEMVCSEVRLDEIQALGINVLERSADRIKIEGEVNQICKLASCDWVLSLNRVGVRKEKEKVMPAESISGEEK